MDPISPACFSRNSNACRRRGLAALILAAGTIGGAALSARGANWITEPKEAFDIAAREKRPVMVWFRKDEGRGEERRHNTLDRKKNKDVDVFDDPALAPLLQRFVLLQADARTQCELMKKLGARPLDVVFATPDGQSLDRVPTRQVSVSKMADTLHAASSKYRQQVFHDSILPTLANGNAPAADVLRALQWIQQSQPAVPAADESVIALLERKSLAPSVQREGFQTLAALSTGAAVKALFDRSAENDEARKALLKITPGGAEALLASLADKDQNARLRAYDALVQVLAIPQKKGKGFFENARTEDQRAEIERVTNLVKARAENWRNTVGKYR